MKRLSMIMVCLLAMMAVSLSAKAQDVTITLYPGWNWISYPKAEVLDVNTALGDFVPMNGDKLQSQFSNSSFSNGQWRGGVTHFIPGWGYKYYSNRTETVSFVFGEAAPQLTVTTVEPTEISANSAICGGNVASVDGNYVFVLLRGICWGTTPNPTFNDNYVEAGNGLGSFAVSLAELFPSTNYYVRAYAVTEEGTFFGEEVGFTTQAPLGAINGLFSVSDSQQVYFSQGNLQYIGSAAIPYWKFADNQWNVLDTNTGQNTGSQNVDRDLFGWGTSGYNHGAYCYQPWSFSLFNDRYYAYGSYSYNLYDQTGQADWGYNPISNGGNQSNQWRTLTTDEWAYVFNTRTTSSGLRYVKANVNNMNGVILLPDDWSTSYYTLSNINSIGASFSSNTITAEQWVALEQHGAVFLPAAGHSHVFSVSGVGYHGCYWSASYYDSNCACRVYFDYSSFLTSPMSTYDRNEGFSVRLVRVAE